MGRPGSGSGATPLASASPTGPASRAIAPTPLTVGIVALDDKVSWRFTTSTCDAGESTLSLTRDGGSSWQSRVAPFDATTRIRVRPNGRAFAVGGNKSADCQPAIRQSEGAAEDWAHAAAASEVWFRDLRDATGVGTPSGKTAKPCGTARVIDLGIADMRAAVLCEDGQVLTSENGGSWARLATAEGALSVAVRDAGEPVLARTGVAGCAGVAVAAASAPERPLGCAASDLRGIGGGQISLSVAKDAAWLLVGERAFRSSGDLSTWRPS